MIRKIKRKDKENWIKLYCGYAKFYKVPMKQEILDTLWSWIHDENHVVNGICYEIEDKIVGIAHYRTCLLYTSPSPRDAHESRMPSSA